MKDFYDLWVLAGVNYDKALLSELRGLLESFLLPPTQTISRNEEFMAHWPTGGPWKAQCK